MNEDEIANTLDKVVPEREVPDDVLAGARRRRRRTRTVTGVAALALVAAVAVPLGLVLGGDGRVDATASEDLSGTSALLDLPLDETPHTDEAARASARVAWEVMVADQNVRTNNAAISPSSLAVTLAMLAEGASGHSLTSLDEAFGLAGDERSAAMGALRQALAPYEDLPASVDADDPPEAPVVHQANRVVILDDAEVQQPFLDRLASYYDTAAKRLPAADAKADLDAWARKHTAGLIEASGIEITPATRLVTQDALLFAAAWRDAFERDDYPLEFETGDGGREIVDAMVDTFNVPYATGDGWEAVRLPYDDVLAMDVILPEEGIHPSELGFDAVDASTTALSEAAEASVSLTMPPSDIKSQLDLLTPLADQGVDLSELDGIFDGALTAQLVQQVRLTVTAKGTVGAALTEAAVEESAVELPDDRKVVTVDRPFVMRVLDTRTGWPLFVAIVSNPAELPG